ncbi:hypothetical protein C8A00DRAFT_32657 [Chaetomidium leptoderma]|uniref:Uncharacterized protein n=1 Tax=Chaetomidium leptoderma TaxID=669021 RepID=A0AAN6VMW1_9PEZI|nr:hypothetical protein C8A00DRAFT_32657 [Chaetomidium leptoderma]
MEKGQNPKVEELKVLVWIFRRSLEPLATQQEGQGLRATWSHGTTSRVSGSPTRMAVPKKGSAGIAPRPLISRTTEPMQLCDRVSEQVVDAVMEMSKWTVNQVMGVDGRLPPDPNFTEGHTREPSWSRDQLVQNCNHAGLDHQKTAFGPGDLSPWNIVLDDNDNFVGFTALDEASFAPRNWVQLGLMDPAAKEEADVAVYGACMLRGADKASFVPQNGPNSILLVWQNPLSDKLAANGFAKLEPHRFPWLRRRGPTLMGTSWQELDDRVKREGKSSWQDLLSESEREESWWYQYTKGGKGQ